MTVRFALIAALLAGLGACAAKDAPAEPEAPAQPAAPAEPVETTPAVIPEGFEDQLCSYGSEEMCQRRLDALAAIDLDACGASHGEIVQDGMLGTPLCRVPFADAGKACTDGDECEGKCIGTPEEGGQCQAYAPLFGCYSSMEDGKVDYTICVD